MDIFQKRYLDHLEKKGFELSDTGLFKKDKKIYTIDEYNTVISLLENRTSQRNFNSAHITDEQMDHIMYAISLAPSSCNRQAIYIKEVEPAYAEKMLVGGRGWLNNADRVILLFGDKVAYKSPNEKEFMPYLDAGFVGENIYIICDAIGVGTCFINPNIRVENKEDFISTHGDDYFCGGFAFGNYDKKLKLRPKRDYKEVLRK